MVHSNDPVIRALASPTPIQRAVVVLVGGLSLRLQTVSTITGLDTIELNRICLDAFDEVRLAALGRLEYSGTRQLQFVIASSGETYDLVPTEASQDVCTDILLGRQVLLKGTIPASKLGGPKVIRFESLVETGSN